MNEPLVIGADWDKSLTNTGENRLNPRIQSLLLSEVGKSIYLEILTGRFPRQIQVLGDVALKRILFANRTWNPREVNVYAGGAMVADVDGKLLNHEQHELNKDQIDVISILTQQLRDAGYNPFIVFQAVKHSARPRGEYKAGETHMLYTEESVINDDRLAMYQNINQMPENIFLLSSFIDGHKPSKLIIVSPALHLSEARTQILRVIHDRLAAAGLEATGNAHSGIDISRKGVNKATGLDLALEATNTQKLDYYIGDSIEPFGNDIPVFDSRKVSRGIVVVNGAEHPEAAWPRIPYQKVLGADQLADLLEVMVREG